MKAEAIYLEIDAKDDLVSVRVNQAKIHAELGAMAAGAYEKAEASYIEADDKDGLQRCYGDHGVLLFKLDRLKEASELLGKQLDVCDEIGNKESLQRCLGNLANVFFSVGALDVALEMQRQRETLCLELNNQEGLGYCYWNLADIHAAKGDQAAQVDKLQKALAIFEELETTPSATRCRPNFTM